MENSKVYEKSEKPSQKESDGLRPEIMSDAEREIYLSKAKAAVAAITEAVYGKGTLPGLVLTDSSPVNPRGDKEARAAHLNAKDKFNKMIAGDGVLVVAQPKKHQPDYFNKVDGLDSPGLFWNGTDGVITKAGAAKFIKEMNNNPQSRFNSDSKKHFVKALSNLLANWDNPNMEPYKDSRGNISRESFAKGLQGLPGEERAVKEGRAKLDAEQKQRDEEFRKLLKISNPIEQPKVIVSTPTTDKQSAPEVVKPDVIKPEVKKPEIKMPEVKVGEDTKTILPPRNPFKPQIAEKTLEDGAVRKGEGPYQVALRLLTENGKADNREVKLLTQAMQAQYREENPNDKQMAGLRVKHHFVSPNNLDKLLSHISDQALKSKLDQRFRKAS